MTMSELAEYASPDVSPEDQMDLETLRREYRRLHEQNRAL